MKQKKGILSVLVFVLALSAALATTMDTVYFTTVWKRHSAGGDCTTTTCLVSGSSDCSAAGFNYYNNANCDAPTISPRKN